MLIEFSVENFRSIKDRVTLSMVASTAKKEDPKIEHNVMRDAGGSKYDLLRSAVIYGANASGKSNLLSAIRVLRVLVLSSSDPKREKADRGLHPFRLLEGNEELPCRFEIVFLMDGIEHRYCVAADNERIHEESLVTLPKGQPRTIFLRDGDNFDKKNWKGPWKNLVAMTRPDSLFLSVAAQFNNEIATRIVSWLSSSLSGINTDPVWMAEWDFTNYLVNKNEKARGAILALLHNADIGISDVVIEKDDVVRLFESGRFGPVSKRAVEDFRKDFDEKSPEVLYPMMAHTRELAEGQDQVLFPCLEESDGTLKYYSILGPIWSALEHGIVLYADELETRLHPLLAETIIKLFHNPKTNPNGAQLIFTTHNTTLMQQDLFRRDQIWFTEKGRDGATDLFSLWDFKPRQGENIERKYLMGRFGGIPIINEPPEVD